MVEQYISALRKLKERPIETDLDLDIWKAHATNILKRAFGPDSPQEGQVQRIAYRSYPASVVSFRGEAPDQWFGGGDNIVECRQQADSLIDAFAEELETFGLPPEPAPTPSGDRISVTVNQSQTVSVSTIMGVLQHELTGRQAEEISKILSEPSEPAEKKRKLTEKLASFGGDVLSNVVASLLTNPQVLGAVM